MGTRRILGALLGAVLAASMLGGCATPQRWQSTLISHNAATTNGGNGPSTGPSISADGTKVAFASDARNLGVPDTNGTTDVFVRDTTTGSITLVSINRQGTNSGNGPSFSPRISADGTKVAFLSSATNLQPLPLTGDMWVYVRDLTTGTTTVATVNAAGTAAAGLNDIFEATDMFDFSADGTKVAFISDASDLVEGLGGSPGFQLFVRDLPSATTSLASIDAAGSGYGNSVSLFPRLAPNGDGVTFTSFATNLVPGGSTEAPFLFVRDLSAGATSPLAPGIGSGLGTTPSNTTFSTDGTRVVFESFSSPPGVTDTNGTSDVYVADLAAGTTSLVSVRAGGADSGNGMSGEASFSPDGTQVVFTSSASDLVAGDGNEEGDVFVRDLVAGTTSVVSVDDDGDSAVAGSRRGLFAGDGRVLFESLAWDLGPNDTNNDWDLYIRSLDTGVTSLVSARADGADSGDEASTTGAFGGGKVAYQSRATDLAGTDTNGDWDVYLAMPFTPPPATTTTTRPPPTTGTTSTSTTTVSTTTTTETTVPPDPG
jgi:Tol biopolymer transport system component